MDLEQATTTTIARPSAALIRHSSLPPDQREFVEQLMRRKQQRVIQDVQIWQKLYTLLFTSPAIPPSILPRFTIRQHLQPDYRVTQISYTACPSPSGVTEAKRSNIAHSPITGISDAESADSVKPSSVPKKLRMPRIIHISDAESADSVKPSSVPKKLRMPGIIHYAGSSTVSDKELRDAYDQSLLEIDKLLDPLTSEGDHSDGFVFLCWGNATSCRVKAVKHFQHDMDHELFWKKLKGAWSEARGRWLWVIPWYGICSVKKVNVRLVGPMVDSPEQFYGIYQLLDEEEIQERNKLREDGDCDHYHGGYNGYYDEYDIYHDGYDMDECIYDKKVNRVTHSDPCSLSSKVWGPFCVCHVEHRYKSRDRLNGLMMEPLRTELFRNPRLAGYHKLLNKDLVHFKRDVISQYQEGYCRGLGQLTFRALLVEDGWMFEPSVGVICMPLAGIVSLLIVLLAWVIYGDWGIAWNVGSCIVPLLIGLVSALPQAKAPTA